MLFGYIYGLLLFYIELLSLIYLKLSDL